MIMSESPGTSTDERARRAEFLFEVGVRSVHFATGLVLAIYDVSFDTGMIIDVGECAAYIFAIFDGLSVLEAATRHPLEASPGGRIGSFARLAGAGGAETKAEADQLPGELETPPYIFHAHATHAPCKHHAQSMHAPCTCQAHAMHARHT